MQRGDPGTDARAEARAATRREPGSALAWVVLAEAELDAGDAIAGEAAARQSLALSPGYPEALARLGRAQWMSNQPGQATESLRAAASNAPGHPGIAVWLGHVLEDTGDAEGASEAYARAYALVPDEAQVAAYLLAWRRRLCDWRGLDALAVKVRAAVRAGNAAIEPFAFLSEDASAAEQLRCAQLRAQQVAQQVRPLPPPLPIGSGQPLRLGFVSNGFGAHPTGLLTVALFEALRLLPCIDVHLFALTRDDGSAIRRRLAAATTLHETAGLAHRQIAQRIRDARIDVLHDLRGWGGGGVPSVLAMRPAPLQVNWLAYPGTSGAPWIDYVIADGFVLPPTLAPHFSESVARLPRCFQPNDTARAIPAPPARADCGLPDDGVVFCSFNNSYKTNPSSFARAMAVLRSVPGSVLWLLSGPGLADTRLREAAQGGGIDPRRLVFMPKQPHALYLAHLQLADLFLDSNPYNAHTTASDALWTGCPVLTRPGDTFAARVAGSLNHHLGLHALNAADDETYVALATELGNDPPRLATLRGQLATSRAESGLFDMQAFARDFAALAARMAEHHRQGLAPAALD